MFCRKCGKELLQDSKFCSYCGVGISNKMDEKIEIKSTKTEQRQEKIDVSSGKRTYRIITIIVASLAAIAPSISKKVFLPLDGLINALIWFGVLSLISLFIFPRTKLDHKETKTPINNKEENESPILDDSGKPIFNVGPSFIWVYIFIFLLFFLLVAVFGLLNE